LTKVFNSLGVIVPHSLPPRELR